MDAPNLDVLLEVARTGLYGVQNTHTYGPVVGHVPKPRPRD